MPRKRMFRFNVRKLRESGSKTFDGLAIDLEKRMEVNSRGDTHDSVDVGLRRV